MTVAELKAALPTFDTVTFYELLDSLGDLKNELPKARMLIDIAWNKLCSYDRHVLIRNIDTHIAHWEDARRCGKSDFDFSAWQAFQYELWGRNDRR